MAEASHVFIRDGHQVLIKREDRAERNGQEHGNRNGDQLGRLQCCLHEGQLSKRRWGSPGERRPQPLRENRLPRGHPEEQGGETERGRSNVLIRCGAAPHVGPEEQEGESEWQCSDIVGRDRSRRGVAQEISGLLDQVQRSFVMPACHLFPPRGSVVNGGGN